MVQMDHLPFGNESISYYKFSTSIHKALISNPPQKKKKKLPTGETNDGLFFLHMLAVLKQGDKFQDVTSTWLAFWGSCPLIPRFAAIPPAQPSSESAAKGRGVTTAPIAWWTRLAT